MKQDRRGFLGAVLAFLGLGAVAKTAPKAQAKPVAPISECPMLLYKDTELGRLTEFEYVTAESVNADGYRTVTVTGHLRTCRDEKPDMYRNKIAPPLAHGFKRAQSYSIGLFDREMRWTITDTEMTR